MKQKGRKSAAQVVAKMMVVDASYEAKAEPPAGMPERQAAIWQEIVRSEPAEFFETGSLRGLLQELCRHKAVSDEMSKMIDAFDPAWLAEAKGMRRYEWLCKMRRMETKAAMDLATKLRLTNSSRHCKRDAEAIVENDEGEASPWAKSA